MKKIYVHPDLMSVFNSMVVNNQEDKTKVVKTLIEANKRSK